MALKQITGRQCKKARNLLKWNQRDLSNRSSVDVKRIDSFEKGVIRLYKGEMDNMIQCLNKENIEFKSTTEVELKTAKANVTAGTIKSYKVTDEHFNSEEVSNSENKAESTGRRFRRNRE